ncbi:MAG: glutaredoxin family protein [Zoogloeaceae bacterium]|jgi:glutaredoxin|nr:glutaredoxin family protein [Zoogloeaceae bacterium]
MPQICPHCNHLRKENEATPVWQCPACKQAYAGKTNGAASIRQPVSVRYGPQTRSGGGSGKRWLLLIALLAIAAAVWWWQPAYFLENLIDNLKISSPKADDPKVGSPKANNLGEQPRVVLYATTWCGYCAAARKFFRKNRIEYTEYDIEKDAVARRERDQLGGGGIVPLIIVGNAVFPGYDEAELRRALRPWLRNS